MSKIIFLLTLLSLSPWLLGQKHQLHWIDGPKKKGLPRPPKQLSPDSLGLAKLKQWRENCLNAGFPYWSLDSFVHTDHTWQLWVYQGPRQKIKIYADSLHQAQFGLKSQQAYPQQLQDQANKQIKFWQNHAHPFVQIQILPSPNQTETWQWQAELGPAFRFKTLSFEGKTPEKLGISAKRLSQQLQIKAGQAYEEQKILQIPSRLSRLPYLRSLRPPEVLFQGQEAEVVLFLDKRSANRFDLLLGFLPNNRNDLPLGQTPRLILTGQVLLDLQNTLGLGERLRLQWQQFRPETSTFEAGLDWPQLLGLSLDGKAHFQLHRRDSSFLDRQGQLALEQDLDRLGKWGLAWHNLGNSLLSVDTSNLRLRRSLPSSLDFRENQFRLTWLGDWTDDYFLPRQGLYVSVDLGWGRQLRLPNARILAMPADANFDPLALYAALGRGRDRFRLQFQSNYYQDLGQNLSLKYQLEGRYLGGRDLLQNELWRIGGLRTMRGFDEESLFVEAWGRGFIELRWHSQEQTFFFIFIETGRSFSTTGLQQARQLGSGGLGLQLDTQAGQFNLTYALGQVLGQRLRWAGGKIHFGYVNRF